MRQILHSNLKFYPYKIEIVAELKPSDYMTCQQYTKFI